MSEGYRDDGGKPRPDLIPYDGILGIAQVLTWACTSKKPTPYPERNWENGMKFSRIFNSAMRHAWAMWLAKIGFGSELDPESGLPHVDHFATNAVMLSASFRRPWLSQFDDRPSWGLPEISDPLKDCPSCLGTKGYHRTPCQVFSVEHRGPK